jgi:hypothetical protein
MLPKMQSQPVVNGTPVKPRDCAIAICVPLDCETFVRAFTCGAEGTFVRDNAREVDKYLSPTQRWIAYEPLATLIGQVLAYAERLGVKVVRNGTLDQFGTLCESYPVVSLVAHWRSARFRESDLVDRALLERMIEPADSKLRGLLWELTGGFEAVEDLLTIRNKALDRWCRGRTICGFVDGGSAQRDADRLASPTGHD